MFRVKKIERILFLPHIFHLFNSGNFANTKAHSKRHSAEQTGNQKRRKKRLDIIIRYYYLK